MKRTYALFDVIGVKEAIRQGNAQDLLDRFWQATESLTNNAPQEPYSPLDGDVMRVPRIYTRVFADNALLFLDPEYPLEVFYEIIKEFREAFRRSNVPVYVVAACLDEYVPTPPAGSPVIVSDAGGQPRFVQVTRCGLGWGLLIAAAKEVGQVREWREKRYSLYCVGEDALPKSMEVKGRHGFQDSELFALD